MWKHLTAVTAAAACIAATGSAFGTGRRDEPPARQTDRNRDADKQMHQLVFTAGTKMQGSTVKNAQDKTLGTVDDMIIERGSGRIDYMVLKTGAVLGMGGKLVTVPYRSMGWDNVAKVATLSATTEELKAWPEFNRDRWMEGPRAEDSLARTLGKEYYETANSPWPVQAKSDRTTTIKGRVKTITRRTVNGRAEEILLIVQPEHGSETEIVLGPSWYMTGNNSTAIFREADVDAATFQFQRDGRTINMARTVRVNGKEMTFYDAQGRAMWAPTSTAKDGQTSSTPLLLFSEIRGKGVECRGDKCGSVKDLVVECRSGQVAFLSVDPDKGFLGIGDENRLVPWPVLTGVWDGNVHVDASKAMLTNAPTTPSDLETLADDNLYQRVFAAFDVPAVKFRVRRDTGHDETRKPGE